MKRARTPAWREVAAVARLDGAEVLRSRWLLLVVGTQVGIAALFLLAGLRESSVVAFTGSGRALVGFTHALLVLLPGMALLSTGQVVPQARSEGTLELLFGNPVGRGTCLAGITLVRFALVVVPLLVVTAGVAAFGSVVRGQAMPWEWLARCAAVGTTLCWAFTGLGLLVSVRARGPAQALTLVLVTWLAGVALLDFALAGLMLSWRLDPRTVLTVSALNPVQAARVALLSSADPELATLGPVGFFLATRVGARWLLALGLLWPSTVGTAAWLAALSSFRRCDVA